MQSERMERPFASSVHHFPEVIIICMYSSHVALLFFCFFVYIHLKQNIMISHCKYNNT